MPTTSRMRRKRGLSRTEEEASANMATKPPSPLLSARSTKVTYLSDTMNVSVQKNKERMPMTLSGVKAT